MGGVIYIGLGEKGKKNSGLDGQRLIMKTERKREMLEA